MDLHFSGLREPILMRTAPKCPKHTKKNVHWAESLEDICYIPSRTNDIVYSRNKDLRTILFIENERNIESMNSDRLRKEMDLFLVEELLADLV